MKRRVMVEVTGEDGAALRHLISEVERTGEGHVGRYRSLVLGEWQCGQRIGHLWHGGDPLRPRRTAGRMVRNLPEPT